ncbi:hypothetical protein ACUL41_06605 [Virgibacillus natechei]|uniref:hypothetical protein n=1 Tax=Virgibacillus sp. CBA3643 TaxID=2942278 RepID=UPI0035A36637
MLPLRELLATYYAIQTEEKLMLDGKEGYRHGEYVYFTISADNKEIIYMEQAALAYYLVENGYSHLAIPIPNVHGEWFSPHQEKKYIVLQVQYTQAESEFTNGVLLANFHQVGSAYSYEPQAISSYGGWKQLWIDKLTVFETKIEKDAMDHTSNYSRLLMDVLPYIIGISENAIQYIGESEKDYRFHDADQGTIAFRRYAGNLVNPVLWTNDLVYDHPTRDLAEYIRLLMLGNNDEQDIVTFLNDYQSIRPLSVFSWRLLYARLIFPMHLFDVIGKGFLNQEPADQLHEEMTVLLDKQAIYEEKLRHFFQIADVETDSAHIPVLHWL